MANRPVKTYKAKNIQGAIWENEREKNGVVIGFKTISIRRSWYDKDKEMWRDETMNLHKTDIPKLLVILNKVQEELLLNHEDKQEESEEDE